MTPASDDKLDSLPRSAADLEEELEALREFVINGGVATRHHRLWLDLDEFEARLDQIIALLPREVRRARRISREEQRIIQDAKDEARRVLEEARAEGEQIVRAAEEEAARLVESSAIRQRAIEQAEATLAQAEQTAREIRSNSYGYAVQVMDNVTESLRQLTHTVEQDRSQLQQMSPNPSED